MFKYIRVTILFLFVLTACQTDIENKKLDQTSSTNNVSAEAEEPMSESKEGTVNKFV
ncbi:hypothetical protein P4619_20560 [Halalkalibacterium halodurans]|uniref:hypothetical protein n=1 Tax=Halalkalibacterium halodurans TaxID=86665 RepID=UPI002E1EAFE0|nr:hypothetical protein [Halalkalibacterium halodurans]MED4151058.1 hypothetical protein [Halalkalibacterium halodurans]MED4188938.1 hypothetical protein [Halalkalibacterium halodurans]MED4196898.1 hypothetical protein [Halalkalibacterium halodurans]